MAGQAARHPVNDAGHGRAVLELADAALDALRQSDRREGSAFCCGTTAMGVRIDGTETTPAACSHLPRADRAPELVVHVCDGDFPGGGGPPPEGFHRVRDEQLFVSVTDDPPAVAALRNSDHTAISWIDDRAHEPVYSRFRPFAEILSAWFPSRGMLLLHAAAVGDADGAVLLVGDGGSGKSTTAVLCSERGLGFLADDFCLLEPGSPPRVHSIYRSAKLREESARRVPAVSTAPGDTVDGDHYFLVDEAVTVVSAPVRAIVATRPADRGTTPHLDPVPPDEVLPLLLPTALKVASGGAPAYRHWLRAAHTMTRTIPASTLSLTWDTDRVVALVEEALRTDRSLPC